MPQRRRKVPFSGKAKKQQMQNKKQKHHQPLFVNSDSDEHDEHDKYMMNSMERTRVVQRINKQPRGNESCKNSYTLQFFQEHKNELLRRKKQAMRRLHPVTLKDQEVSDDYFPISIDMPIRPPWNFEITKEELEMTEQRYFRGYLTEMEMEDTLSYFELNLETWRQLWRVLEMSDVLLIIVDIRYPVLMFPPYLYYHVTNELQKDMILVLNKVDLAPPPLVAAWKEYFHNQYSELHILMFTSYPTYNLHGNINNDKGVQQRRRQGKMKMAAEGAQKLLETCKNIVKGKVDLSSWHTKIQEEMNSEYDLDDVSHRDNITIEAKDTSYFEHEKYKNGILTIGCIGAPNVGKSSLMNALMGKKVVSVSRTPGHTKHFQTIYLTKTVCLCDCPGLVFPSTVPKQLQILMGSFPIAQVREPYTAVQFLAERLDLPTLLKISHPENDDAWSAMDICDGWAAKKNFITARTARLDTYRAANSLLRMALEGKICLYTYPPNWTVDQKKWQDHADVETVKWIQARNLATDDSNIPSMLMSSSEDEETYNEKRESSGNVASANCPKVSSEEDDMPCVTNKFSLLPIE